MMHNAKRKPIIIVLFIALAITVVGTVTMLLWNWLVPDLFGGPSVTWLQAIGLLVLSQILLSSGRKRGHWRRHNGGWRHDLHEKFHEDDNSDDEATGEGAKE